jgi:cobalt-zinc-cadmium efflux system protein
MANTCTDGCNDHDGPKGHSSTKMEKSFIIALILNSGLAVVEMGAGIILNSSALLADGFMNVDDTAALVLSIYSERKTRQAPDERRTFGYKRMDAFAGFVKGCLLLVTAFMALLQALTLILDPEPIQGIPVMIIGTIAIVVNFVSAFGLKADACCSLNAKGTYECLKYDVVGSAAVVISGFLSYYFGYVYFDVAAALLITFFMARTGWGIFKEGMGYFLQSAPEGFKYEEFESAVLAVKGITSVGDIHVWSQNPSEHHLTCKVTVKIEDVCDCEKIIGKVEGICSQFGIHHATIQPVYSAETLNRFCKT